MASHNRDSKAISNLKSAVNSTINTTGRIASKGTVKTFKWLASSQPRASRPRTGRSLTEISQNVNYHMANMALTKRIQKRINDERSKNYSSESLARWRIRRFKGWFIDHSIYVIELIWGFFQPILSEFVSYIALTLVIAVANILFFGAIFLLLFADK